MLVGMRVGGWYVGRRTVCDGRAHTERQCRDADGICYGAVLGSLPMVLASQCDCVPMPSIALAKRASPSPRPSSM
jgi:hypothetical protein